MRLFYNWSSYSSFKFARKLIDYEFKSNDTKITRPKYDIVSGRFLGRVETLGYLIVSGDKFEFFLDYGYSKNISKILYGTR